MKLKLGIFSLACASILLVSLSAAAATFNDVDEKSSTHYAAIEYLYSKGVIKGYDDGTFKPDQTINRAEALKMVMLATGKNGESTQNMEFPDVMPEDWFYNYVRKGVEIKLVEGYDDGSFKPGNNINIAESLKIILLAFDQNVGDPPTKNPYPDVDVLAWYSSYAEYGRAKQVIECLDDGLLHADRDITRGEFAEVIYRLMYMDENDLDVFPLSTNWPTYFDAANNYSIKYPSDWKIIKAGDQVIFWKKDDINEQLSWIRVFPNSVTVVVAVDPNDAKMDLDKYMDLLDYDGSAKKQVKELNGYPFASISIEDAGINDYYFEMPDGKILVAYTQVGSGNNQTLLLEKIRYLAGSIAHYTGEETGQSSLDMDRETFLSEVRKKILVEDEGQAALEMFDDEILLETDTIGIGTGPVDYYFSSKYNVTLKFERDSDTLLAINDGNGTAF